MKKRKTIKHKLVSVLFCFFGFFFTDTEQHTPVLWRALGFLHSLWRGTCLWSEWGRWEHIWNRQACTRSTWRSPRTPSSQTGISWRWAQGWAQRRLCWSGQSDWKDNNDDDKEKKQNRHVLVKVVIKKKRKIKQPPQWNVTSSWRMTSWLRKSCGWYQWWLTSSSCTSSKTWAYCWPAPRSVE